MRTTVLVKKFEKKAIIDSRICRWGDKMKIGFGKLITKMCLASRGLASSGLASSGLAVSTIENL